MIVASPHRKRRANKAKAVSACFVREVARGSNCSTAVPIGASLPTCNRAADAAGYKLAIVDDMANGTARIVDESHCHFIAIDCDKVKNVLIRARKRGIADFDEQLVEIGPYVGDDGKARMGYHRIAIVRSGAENLRAFINGGGCEDRFRVVETRASHVGRCSGSGPLKH